MDGASYCWGRNDSGQLGTNLVAETCMSGVSRPCGTTPVAVSGGLSFVSLDVGASVTCALTAGGAAYC